MQDDSLLYELISFQHATLPKHHTSVVSGSFCSPLVICIKRLDASSTLLYCGLHYSGFLTLRKITTWTHTLDAFKYRGGYEKFAIFG